MSAYVSWQLALAQSAAGTARRVVQRATERHGFARADAQRAADVAARIVAIATQDGPAPSDEVGGLLAMTQKVERTISLHVFWVECGARITVSAERVSSAQHDALCEVGARVEMEPGGPLFTALVAPAPTLTPPSSDAGSAADPAHPAAGPAHAAGAGYPAAEPARPAAGAGGVVEPAGPAVTWFGSRSA